MPRGKLQNILEIFLKSSFIHSFKKYIWGPTVCYAPFQAQAIPGKQNGQTVLLTLTYISLSKEISQIRWRSMSDGGLSMGRKSEEGGQIVSWGAGEKGVQWTDSPTRWLLSEPGGHLGEGVPRRGYPSGDAPGNILLVYPQNKSCLYLIFTPRKLSLERKKNGHTESGGTWRLSRSGSCGNFRDRQGKNSEAGQSGGQCAGI